MAVKYKSQRATLGIVMDKVLKYIDKNPQENLMTVLKTAKKLTGNSFPESTFKRAESIIYDSESPWNKYIYMMLNDIDRDVIKKTGLALGVSAAVHGTKEVRENREKYKCNIPWVILMDPTSACNLKCTGCWAAEYGHKQSLTYDEMADVINQGKELGTYFYMFTGGEPLMRKDDIIKLCKANPDCAFLAYTNSTLVDQKFCDEMREAGNISLAISIEGGEENTDQRRGDGIYKKIIAAMDLLKKNKLLFGFSICYTHRNVKDITSDKFIDLMIEKGCKFGWYFNYMPVGNGAVPELIPTPEDREYMYKRIRSVRSFTKDAKPIFLVDFQNDGEYVGGCIAGGRNYFHINSAGDIEPCVFIHYSDSNIRKNTLLEALQSPLFQAYRHNQPFNDNQLRPCPMLENPEWLRKMVKQTGAKSTDLLSPEDVDSLCSKCDKFAAAWAPEADRIWNTHEHANPKTQYYRDTEEAKLEKQQKEKAE